MAKKCKSPDTKYIQNIIDENKINVNDIKALSGIDYLLGREKVVILQTNLGGFSFLEKYARQLFVIL